MDNSNRNKKNGSIKIVIGILLWILPMLVHVSEFSENYSNFYVISLVFKILGSLLIFIGLIDLFVRRKLPLSAISGLTPEKSKRTGTKAILAIVFLGIMFLVATSERISEFYLIFWAISFGFMIAAFGDTNKKGVSKFLLGLVLNVIYIALLLAGIVVGMRTSWF